MTERDILRKDLVSQLSSTPEYCRDKEDVVEFVADYIRISKRDSLLTIAIEPAKSEGFSVRIATVPLRPSTTKPNTLHPLQSISDPHEQVGLYQPGDLVGASGNLEELESKK